LTCPIPEPVALVTVIQLTLLTAVHKQLVPVVTESEFDAHPVEGTVRFVGVTVALVHWAEAVRTSSIRTRATRSQK
jgi:hypothetical protein